MKDSEATDLENTQQFAVSKTETTQPKIAEVDQAKAVVEDDETEKNVQLPFGFAKRHNVLLSREESGFVLHFLADVTTPILLDPSVLKGGI